MLKTTQEFESAMLKILIAFRDNQSVYDMVNSNTDFGDALERCVQLQYVTGVIIDRNANNDVMPTIINPRLTHQGLQFIDSHS